MRCVCLRVLAALMAPGKKLMVSLVVRDQVTPQSFSSTGTPQSCVPSPLLLSNAMKLKINLQWIDTAQKNWGLNYSTAKEHTNMSALSYRDFMGGFFLYVDIEKAKNVYEEFLWRSLTTLRKHLEK